MVTGRFGVQGRYAVECPQSVPKKKETQEHTTGLEGTRVNKEGRVSGARIYSVARVIR